MRFGQARVRSVDTDPSYTLQKGQAVIVPATAEWGVSEIVAPYLGEYPPRPGGSCWYVTDGVDRIILGMVAPDGPPAASISLTSATATTTATNSTVVMSTVEYDPWNMTSTSGTGLTIPVGGMYAITGFQTYAANATGFRQITLRRNGSNLESVRLPTTSASNPIINLTMPGYPCNKGDIISMIGQQTSGTTINMNAASLSVQYVGRRRTSGTGADVMVDGNFASSSLNVSGESYWFTEVAGASAAALDTTNNYLANINSVKFTAVTSTTNYLFTTQSIPCVPGQKYTISIALKASVAMTQATDVDTAIGLYGAVSGPPSENRLGWGTYISTSNTLPNLTTSYVVQTGTVTIPDGIFVMRPAFLVRRIAASTQSVWVGNITMTEIIS
jgi:hypothetical protein